MDEQLRSLIQQKLETISQDQYAHLTPQVDAQWKKVTPGPDCIWFVDLMENVQRLCHRTIVQRGARFADTLTDTLRNVRPSYESNLAAELKAIVDPLLPEDLYVYASINCRGVFQRHGNPQKFNDSIFEQLVAMARADSMNTTRDAKNTAHIAIDEYVLSMKNQQSVQPTTRDRWMDSVQLRPSFFGIGIDLKKLFSRKKPPSRD